MRLIDLKYLFQFAGDQKVKETGMYTKGQNKAWNTIRAMCHSENGFKTVDAEPVRHGHWEPHGDTQMECSCCGNITSVETCMGKPIYDYCPRCGARMDEVYRED